jgi:hypothetical protein
MDGRKPAFERAKRLLVSRRRIKRLTRNKRRA